MPHAPRGPSVRADAQPNSSCARPSNWHGVLNARLTRGRPCSHLARPGGLLRRHGKQAGELPENKRMGGLPRQLQPGAASAAFARHDKPVNHGSSCPRGPTGVGLLMCGVLAPPHARPVRVPSACGARRTKSASMLMHTHAHAHTHAHTHARARARCTTASAGRTVPQATADKHGAKCLSGAAPTVEVRLNASSTKWVLFLEGGGWCYGATANATVASCAGRGGFVPNGIAGEGLPAHSQASHFLSSSNPKQRARVTLLIFVGLATRRAHHAGPTATGARTRTYTHVRATKRARRGRHPPPHQTIERVRCCGVAHVHTKLSHSAANRFAVNPFLCTTLNHHVKKEHLNTDGVNNALSAMA